MKINFKELKVYTDIAHKQCVERDIREEFANIIYQTATGIASYSLALKIYNSQGEEEYNDKECAFIKQTVETHCTPVFIDAINMVLN